MNPHFSDPGVGRRERRRVADDEEGVPRAREGDVEAPLVGDEAEGGAALALGVALARGPVVSKARGSHGGDDDDVGLGALERVDGPDADGAVGRVPGDVPLQGLVQVLDLGGVEGDDGDVEEAVAVGRRRRRERVDEGFDLGSTRGGL